jgi:hypothetical protein
MGGYTRLAPMFCREVSGISGSTNGGTSLRRVDLNLPVAKIILAEGDRGPEP